MTADWNFASGEMKWINMKTIVIDKNVKFVLFAALEVTLKHEFEGIVDLLLLRK